MFLVLAFVLEYWYIGTAHCLNIANLRVNEFIANQAKGRENFRTGLMILKCTRYYRV